MKSKGQMQIVFGMIVVLVIVGVVLGFRFLGKSKVAEEPASEAEKELAKQIGGPPLLNNLLPSGVLPAGTAETKISVDTSEPGYCRYSTEPGKSYDAMTSRFSYDKNKTFHSAKVKGLKNGLIYTYYVRCRDLGGDKNEADALIQFSIGGSSPAYLNAPGSQTGSDEAPPLLSNLLPSGTLPAGTTETEISVNTSESSYCRYSSEPGQSYDSMKGRFSYDKNKLLHTATVRGLADNKIYEYYVRCRDLKGNKNTDDAQIRFGLGVEGIVGSPTGKDTVPPSCFDPLPEKDAELPFTTRQTTISLKTNEKAICRYDTISGMSYYSMNKVFANSSGTFHFTEVTGLSEGMEHKYYVKCVDEQGNQNTNDFLISFKVKAVDDYTPPTRRNPYPSGDNFPAGTTQVTISVSTDEPAYCRYSTTQGTTYNSMKGSFSRNDTKTFHSAVIKNLENGKSYEYFVRCKDLKDNVNTGDVMIYFTIE